MLRWRSPLLAGYLNKTVITPGNGRTFPKKGDTVKISFEMHKKMDRLGGETRKMWCIDSMEKQKVLVGPYYTIPAVSNTLPEMSEGEEVLVECSGEYGYGERGIPDSIPANAPLILKLKLHSVYPLDGDRFV